LSGLLAAPLTAWAGGDTGFYLGGGVGQSTIKVDSRSGGNQFKYDDTDSAYKAIVGYNFGIIPLIDLAVEGSYVDFGKIDKSTPFGPSDANASGFDVFGVGALTFGPLGVFAKVGQINWDSDVTFAGVKYSNSGTDSAWGVGARFQLSSFTIRGEYEKFNVSDLNDLSMFSVSALYTF
jgi:outer membrane immunogenic protein